MKKLPWYANSEPKLIPVSNVSNNDSNWCVTQGKDYNSSEEEEVDATSVNGNDTKPEEVS